MHIHLAERVLESERLNAHSRALILDHCPAFYFGNVAPDFQSICNIPRAATHFYELPPVPGEQAYMTMFERYPVLAKASDLSLDRAIFVSAYAAHLMLDLRWYHEVLVPFFIRNDHWKNHHQRFVVHNTLLTFLDNEAFRALSDASGKILSAAKPDGWLPFADDRDLLKWRDYLTDQLQPGAILRTVEIYARRLFISPETFAKNLHDPAWMEEHLFHKVPVKAIKELMNSAVTDTAVLASSYLAN